MLGVAFLAEPWLAARTRAAQFGVGLLWLVLMLAFELLLGRAQGFSWQRIGAEFDPSQGGLMLLGLLILLFAPMAVAWLRRPARPVADGAVDHGQPKRPCRNQPSAAGSASDNRPR